MISNVKILVVDDEPMIRNLTVTALTYCVNREVLSFENGQRAWDYIQQGNEVDIVISDVDMPEMTGFDLMQRVREKFPDKIFIIMSDTMDYEIQSQRKGADAFLGKPFGINDLFSIVQCFVVD